LGRGEEGGFRAEPARVRGNRLRAGRATPGRGCKFHFEFYFFKPDSYKKQQFDLEEDVRKDEAYKFPMFQGFYY
jgi:hypothetical protein